MFCEPATRAFGAGICAKLYDSATAAKKRLRLKNSVCVSGSLARLSAVTSRPTNRPAGANGLSPVCGQMNVTSGYRLAAVRHDLPARRPSLIRPQLVRLVCVFHSTISGGVSACSLGQQGESAGCVDD